MTQSTNIEHMMFSVHTYFHSPCVSHVFKPFAKRTPIVTDDRSKDLQDDFELPQEDIAQRGGRCPISESIQDQVRQALSNLLQLKVSMLAVKRLD